jgi:hypothetical protein
LAAITTIDATSAVMLEQLSKRLAPSGTALYLAHIMAGARHGRALVQYRTIFAGDAGKAQRVATFEPGVIFGEMAVLDGAAVADQPAIVHSVSTAALERLPRSRSRRCC